MRYLGGGRRGRCSVPAPQAGGTQPADRRPAIDRRARLEAVLLIAGEPLSLRRMAQLANLEDGTEARRLLDELRRLYDARGCAFQVEALAGGYQLLTRAKLSPWLTMATRDRQELGLSQPALETLAVAAYRQPVLRAQVEAIRGVQCGELLRQLMERDLLRIVGRSEELGRPILYGTTKRFLRVFGLRSLDDLPALDGHESGDLSNEPEEPEGQSTIPLAAS
ncbi:MAG: SMC-Scp complex subunit ScpB [Planctomycetales bacterium]|nr:SMC-Scp complex subunit ScpB [Planctomycetales bacterium]